jgi:chromosome segregation ATPase
MSSLSGQALHERARSLLALIDGLRIENDLLSARRTLDDWRTEMSSLINSIHLSTTNKLDSLTGRLKQLKERRSTSLRQDIVPSLHRMVVERRKQLSEQELNEMKTKISRVDGELQGFGRLLKKIDSDEKQLIEQMELLKSNFQRAKTTWYR